jgi:hypothetical protein
MSLRLQSARTVEEACAICRPASNRKSAEMSKIEQRCALLNFVIGRDDQPSVTAYVIRSVHANPVVHAARLRCGRKSQASRAMRYGHRRALTCDRSFQKLRPTPQSGASRSALAAFWGRGQDRPRFLKRMPPHPTCRLFGSRACDGRAFANLGLITLPTDLHDWHVDFK